MPSSDSSPTVNLQALAAEVIVSAGNILSAAGFDRADIADFFRQAADQLDAVPAAPLAGESGLARIATQFSRNPAVLELHGLSARAAAMLPLASEDSGLRDGFDLAMQAVPLWSEAQRTLRALAAEGGHELVSDAKERDEQTPTVLLEEFEALYMGVFAIVGAVAEALADRGDDEAFTYLLENLADNGIILNTELRRTFEAGAAKLG